MLSKSLPRRSAFQANLVLAVQMLFESANENPSDKRDAGDRGRERGSDRSAKKWIQIQHNDVAANAQLEGTN